MAKEEKRLNLKEKARRIFGGLHGSYDTLLNALTLYQDTRWKRKLLKMAELEYGAFVLDAGCGTGVLEEFFTGCNVVGVDITEQMIRGAKKKRGHWFSGLVVADAENLPFKNGVFDSIVSCYVPKYCRANALLFELERVAKENARLTVYDFVRPAGWFGPFYAAYIYGFLRGLKVISDLLGRQMVYTFDYLPAIIRQTRWVEEWSRWLPEAHFKLQCVERLTAGVVAALSAVRAR